MDKLKAAISGKTIYLSASEIFSADFEDDPLFLSEADLQSWCTTFGLTWSFSSETQLYTITKQ